MAIVFFSPNGKTAAPRLSFHIGPLNGVIFAERPVINSLRTAKKRRTAYTQGLGVKGFCKMLRFLKFLFVLAVLIGFAVLGYAYLGDLSPRTTVCQRTGDA